MPVVSYHPYPYTCGVSRFNLGLALSMDGYVVSFANWIRNRDMDGDIVLSIKPSEMTVEDRQLLFNRLQCRHEQYGLVLHEFAETELERQMLVCATRIVTVDNEMAKRVRSLGYEVIAGFAPAVLRDEQCKSSELNFLVLGMSHKMNQSLVVRFLDLCKRSGHSYCLDVSAAVHEGQSLGEAFSSMEKVVKSHGEKVRFLGFLSDAALSCAISKCDGVIFLREGIRESNSSVLSAMSFGKPVFVWLDRDSPDWMKHDETVFDVDVLDVLPGAQRRIEVGAAGLEATRQFSFENLGAMLRA